ncbi:hypothetical protein [Pedobacter cryoconitis]|uniref:Uncharacterized protein n=1 Tax=Pedobacter cryoconitis TaxID=188932 RepID=A0A7X0MGX0_9SPHI|nr:hypothetical protein [Pedobacter cryoconitis]MBB6498797.1 hypothetical protein [Pedobacter cryoconitis]
MEIKQSGNIELNGFTITSKTRIDELPDYFTNTIVTQAQVLDEIRPVQFSTGEVELTKHTIHLSLRFEEDILVSVYITIKELDNQYKTADDFYNNLDKRRSQYTKWLKNHVSFNLLDFAEGQIGVGEDKNSNVFIYLHNQNNQWANPKY